MEGAKITTTNRKITNKRRGLEDEVPEYIEGIPKELDFFIPEEEGEEDFSPFTELLEEAEDEEMEGEEEPEVINSSGEEAELAPG